MQEISLKRMNLDFGRVLDGIFPWQTFLWSQEATSRNIEVVNGT